MEVRKCDAFKYADAQKYGVKTYNFFSDSGFVCNILSFSSLICVNKRTGDCEMVFHENDLDTETPGLPTHA